MNKTTSADGTSDQESTQRDRRARRLSRRRTGALVVSAALCFAVSAIYRWQPDSLAGLTLIPAWCWLVPATALTVLGRGRARRVFLLVVLVLWAAFIHLFVEEASSLIRGAFSPGSETLRAEHGSRIRVVTLNCAAADTRAAAEVAKWKPDIVLFQESPRKQELERLSREVFGGECALLSHGDTSILARGRILDDSNGRFAGAQAEMPSGLRVDVFCVHLSPPVFRLDFWTIGFWNDHRDNRVRHRLQILGIMPRVRSATGPTIVGGDFNAPPGDGALFPLRERLVDSFGRAGRGWGNTGTNALPLLRVDQIWVSRHFRVESVRALKTEHSDHRMVVCDLVH